MKFTYDKEKTYIVGVSGGPDSMALLNMLHNDGYKLVVCLVNYNTRKESSIEQASVRNYCLKSKIHYETIDVLYYKKYGNFEAWARDIRYRFFKEILDKFQAEGVFVAHHQDDLLETYLMQKQRRIITKYFGLKEETILYGMKVFRPLLKYTKQELVSYCEENNISYSIDSTNLESDHLRNKIRNTILANYSISQKDELLKKIESDNSKRNKNLQNISRLASLERINISEFDALEAVEKQLLIYEIISNKVEEKPKLTYFRIHEMIRLLQSNKPNVCIKISGLYYFIREYNFFFVGKLNNEEEYTYIMEVPSKLDTNYFECDFSCDISFLKIDSSSYPLTFRNAKKGDEVTIGKVTKKVNRILIDEKVPFQNRKKYPVVVDKNGKIVYIPLYRSQMQKNIANKLKFMIK